MSDPSSIPPLPENATPEEKDAHWLKYVYQGDNQKQLTFRAVLTGGVIGMLMAFAHLYTTLAIGWSFGVTITACIISFVSWNGLARISRGKMEPLSMLENNCMQSTASAAGYSTGGTVGSAFAALLLVTGEHQPWQIVLPMVFFSAALGVFIAIPMKRQMINHEQLQFPSGIAAAETLRSLYTKGVEAAAKAKALIYALIFGALVGWFRNWSMISATLQDKTEGAPDNAFTSVTNVASIPGEIPLPLSPVQGKNLAGLAFEPSVLLIGAGMIVGIRVAASMMIGSCIIYFILTPLLVNYDVTQAGVANYSVAMPIREVKDHGQVLQMIAPTRWGLWLGTAIMVVASLMALALQWKTVIRAFRFRRGPANDDPLARVEVPMSWFLIGVIPIGIALIIVQWLAFKISIPLGTLAVMMSGVIAIVCCRATGETDVTPTGPMGKVIQLLYSVLPGAAGNTTINLMSAGTTSAVGGSSADLLVDLKSGYLLGANPRRQFLAQFFGVFFGTLAIVPAWYLMIPDKAALEKYPAIAANMWKNVAELLTKGIGALPAYAGTAIVVGALVGALLPVVEKLAPKAKRFIPSATGLGLGIALPLSASLSFLVGALITVIWMKRSPKRAEAYNVPIASGLVAGEAMLEAVVAIACTVLALLAKK